MRLSNYFLQTLRETPAEAEVVSHTLMLRASMIRKLAAGVYSYLPLGLRVIRKIENIVRECMNEAGAIELLMPSCQPSELWQESGRWSKYGKELLRIKDRHDREFCYGPTHEEVATDIVRNMVKSYKQLPLNIYQIQTKFRDEVRPRFGLMRGREFIMKDAYSFDADDAGANISYEKMRQAYCKIFEKCGLEYKMVQADSGSIGGSFSNEFMVLASTGEDDILSCSNCDYAANVEKAQAIVPEPVIIPVLDSYSEIATPGTKTIDDVASLLNVNKAVILKVVLVLIDNSDIAAILLRGDHEANLIKLKNFLNVSSVEMAPADIILEKTGLPVGYCGPIGINVPVYADNAVKDLEGTVVGANKKDFHFKDVKCGRDYNPTAFGDFRNAVVGDKCPKCGSPYELYRGIEVGHIFKLGTRYSESMGAKYLDSNGKQQPMIMGCYGIGVGRTAASCIEQNHDDKGMFWPIPIAPFEVAVLPLNSNEEDVVKLADEIYNDLIKAGIDAVIDDRPDRAGSKLADADLIGYPIHINVGKKTIGEGLVEFVERKTMNTYLLTKDAAVNKAVEMVRKVKA